MNHNHNAFENQIIDKDNIQNIEKRFSFDYKRTPKTSYEKT